jgi:general secretion pathway protein D
MKIRSVFMLVTLVLLSTVLQGVARQAAPAQQQAGDSPVSFNIDNTDIYQVIDIIASALNLNYVVDPAVKGTVNIHTGTTLQRTDLLPILETILKINGATMIRSGNFYQIVPAGAAIRQPLALRAGAAGASPDDQIVIQIVRMKFVSATEMERLLKPFLGDGGTISVQGAGNILLVADRQSNLRKLLEIVDAFDSATFEGERVRLIPLKNGLARDLVHDLESVFAGVALSDKEIAIRFVAMDRLNSILVVTPNPEVFPLVEKWLTQLDQPLATAGTRTFIYKAKHARAADLQKVLSQLYGESGGTLAPITPANGVPVPPQGQQPPTAGNPIGAAPGLAAVTQTSTEGTRIITDETNNTLLIQTTQPVFADIERILRELDVQRRQVLIDAQIYEVSLDDSTSLGISWILQNRGTLTPPRTTTASFVTPPGGTTPSLSVQTFAYIGRARELLLFLSAEENRSKVRTLSAPSVLVSDNLAAQFEVGAEVPIPTTSSLTPVQSEGSNLFAQTIQFRTTGVILKVRPQVNEGGNVTLEIAQEVSQATPNTTSGIVAPVIGKSAVNSTIVVDNGQTIALGGFIRESNDFDTSRVPLIGRVPVVGALFGSTTKAKTRSELIVLITPHVLENRSQADLATEELKTKLREIQKVLQ